MTTWMFMVVPSLALVLPGGPSAAGRLIGLKANLVHKLIDRFNAKANFNLR